MSKKPIKKRSRRMTGLVKSELDLPSERVLTFCAEYLVDFNGKRAAIAAGCSPSSAKVRACRWLKDPRVIQAIKDLRADHFASVELRREEWLEQLFYLCTRNAKEFVDPKTGRVLGLHELGERAAACVDGFEVEVHETEDGTVTRTKIRLSSKPQALRMAAEHLGLVQPTGVNVNVGVNWDALLQAAQSVQPPNVEQQLQRLEQKVLDTSSEDA